MGQRLPRGAAARIAQASAAWTATFCLIEWSLHNPYTTDNIVIYQIAAAIVVPLSAGRLGTTAPDRMPDLIALLVFAASTAALGLVILTVYDTALLYNLGHLDARLPVTAGTLAVLAARGGGAIAAAPPARSRGGVDHPVVRRFPAVVLRSRTAGTLRPARLGHYVRCRTAALVLVTAAAVRGIAGTFARSQVSRVRWLAQMAITVAAGLTAPATAASMLRRDGYPESRLLWAAAAFFICATTTCALIDPHTPPSIAARGKARRHRPRQRLRPWTMRCPERRTVTLTPFTSTRVTGPGALFGHR